MTGGLLQIISSGKQDIYLTINPEITFFKKVFRRYTNFSTELNRIVSEFTDMFTMQLNEMSLTDEDKQSQIEERLVRMKIKVPNESREKLGLPPMEGGDEPVDLKAQQSSEQTAQAMSSRTRDQNRSSQATDGKGEPRNPKGQGRTTQ